MDYKSEVLSCVGRVGEGEVPVVGSTAAFRSVQRHWTRAPAAQLAQSAGWIVSFNDLEVSPRQTTS